MKAADARTMRSIDRAAVKDYGMKGLQLMENAGRAVADFIISEIAGAPGASGSLRVSLLAGKGNNGGDAFVAARHLKNSGVSASVYTLQRPGDYSGDAAVNLKIWQKMGGGLSVILSGRGLKRHESALWHSHVIVDGLFGTGLMAAPRGLYADVIRFINSMNKKVVSIDVPSGIDSTTGNAPGATIKAWATVTMALPKTGFFTPTGSLYAGRVEVADIGLPATLVSDETLRWNVICDGWLRSRLKPRERCSHKGSYGHVAVISGSPGKTGAVYMAAMGAMRTGAGLVTIGLPASLNAVMEMKTTEVMTVALPETAEKGIGVDAYDMIRDLIKGKSAVVTGPGLGTSPELLRLMEKLLRGQNPPMVIDADGLSVQAGHLSMLKRSRTDTVLTPHPGEAARLLGVTAEEVQKDRFAAAGKLAEKTGSVVVLKGMHTLVAGPQGSIYINTTGNPGLATAGTGDVLSGMIGGLIAGGHSTLEASAAAVYIHGMAADRVAALKGEAGLIATDLLEALPSVLNSFTA